MTLDIDPDATQTALELADGAGWNHDDTGPADHLTFRKTDVTHHEYYNPYTDRQERDPRVLELTWTVFVSDTGGDVPYLQVYLRGSFSSYPRRHGHGRRQRYGALSHATERGHVTLLGDLLQDALDDFWSDVDAEVRADGLDPSTMRRLAGLEGRFQIRRRQRNRADADEPEPTPIQTSFAFR